jgi:hypothetical protein
MLDALLLLAERQGGFFLRRQALAVGVTDDALGAWLRSTRLTRIRHGAYAPTTTWRAATNVQQLAIRTRATLHRLGDGYVASHTSAAALHGLDLHGTDLATVHVTARGAHRGRTESGVVQHEGAPDDDELVRIDGALTVAAPRAVVESACLASVEGAMVVACSALRDGRADEPSLLDAVRRLSRRPGMRTARLGLSLADPGCHTAGEARSLFMCWEQGLPRPTCQVPVHDAAGLVGVVDAGWLDWHHVGEFDGIVKYGRQNPWSSDPVATLVAEKKREDRIRDTGLGVSRWTWRDLATDVRPRTAARIRAALERSRRWYSTPT